MQNLKFIILCLLLTAIIAIISCAKEEPYGSIRNSENTNQLNSRTSGIIGDNYSESATILGRRRNNPYTVANMTAAYNALYSKSISSLPATHHYVKFSPTSGEHVGLIQEWELAKLIAVFDYPLDYEVSTHGDYYFDPAAPDSLLTFRYASVPVGTIMPSVPYTVLNDLVIPPYNSYLTEMAFYQVGEVYEGDTSPHPDGPGDGDDPNDDCTPGCTNYPCCKLGWIDCGNTLCSLNPIGPLPCSPGDPDWPECLDLSPPDNPEDPGNPGNQEPQYCQCTEYSQSGTYTWTINLPVGEDCSYFEEDYWDYYVRCQSYTPPPPPQPSTNACGCPLPSNIRYPAGCIRVDDDGSPAPVQNVMVKVKDTWFTSDITFTTSQGCWKVEKAYSGRMWMFVQFENQNCEVRAVRNINAELEEGQPAFSLPMIWKALVVADDYVGVFHGPVFNNIEVLYSSGEDEEESLARMYWACAHMINADAQYRALCTGDGVPLPRQGLNYLLKSSSGIAGAPMLQSHPFNQGAQLLVAYQLPHSISFLGEIHAGTILSPDVVRGYDTGSAADFRRINMHELGHTSHYAIVGESYWYAYRTHIVSNDLAGNGEYGSFGNFAPFSDPDRVALGEAIGEYTENIYGRSDPDDDIFFINNFIPAGLMYDLQDDTPNETVTDPNNSALTGPDNINGFTPAMIYGALTPNINSIRQFRDRLSATGLPLTTNTLTNYNTFVDIYDVFN